MSELARNVDIAVLDVVAQPHPYGIYRQIFENTVKNGVRYRGDYFAAITPISSTREDIFTGRLALWMAVDEHSNVLDLDQFIETPLAQSSDVVLPKGKGLNSRLFEFAFNERTHKLYVKLLNDDGKRISPQTAERAFGSIFDELASHLVEELRIQIVPEKDSVEKVLKIDRLSSVIIKLYRENPDQNDGSVNQLLQEELDDQNAKEVTKILKKAPGPAALMLNARNVLMAKAAAISGWVKARGRDGDGRPQEKSTRDYPLVLTIADNPESSFASVRAVAGE